MAKYKVVLSDRALQDTKMLVSYIRDIYQAPLTAKRYMQGLRLSMSWLNDNAHLFTPIPELSLQYGMEVRRLNYKNTAVLYSIIGTTVYVHRVMPAANVWY